MHTRTSPVVNLKQRIQQNYLAGKRAISKITQRVDVAEPGFIRTRAASCALCPRVRGLTRGFIPSPAFAGSIRGSHYVVPCVPVHGFADSPVASLRHPLRGFEHKLLARTQIKVSVSGFAIGSEAPGVEA